MTDAPREPGTRWSPLEDDSVEDDAMDEVLASYTDVIEDRRARQAEDEDEDDHRTDRPGSGGQ